MRFDIGRYEFSSSGSSVDFFNRGCTIARFSAAASIPVDSDMLHIRQSTGANTGAAFLTSQVGTGSRSQCFGGAFLTIANISSTVTGVKSLSSGDARDWMFGAGALAVATRMLSTLLRKCPAKSSTDSERVTGGGGGFRSVL